MKNFKLNFKSIVQRKARWLITLIAILTLGVGQMWAYNIIRNAELAGSSGDWSNSDNMTQVGSSAVYYKTYSSPKATTDLCFRIGSSGWTTAQNASGIDNLNSNITMLSNGDGDSNIKFQVPTSVPVTIYYNSSTKKIWIKVESYKTDVLNGKEMFYYGFTKNWSGDFAHFYDNSTRKFGSWAATSYADGSAKLAIGVYDVSSSTNYSASNSDSYAGVNHLGMAGGDQIQTYTDGSNKCYHNAADQFSFGTTAYTIVVGQTIASFPTISLTSKQSGADADLSLEGYYYSTATSGQTWTAFTPGTTESSLAAGTYYIKAIATDGAIYMASTNYITLTVNSAPVLGVANASSVTSSSATFNATVTLNSNTTSSYGFKYGAGSSYDTQAELISGGTSASTSGALAGTSFSKSVTGLSASTTYYYISYAVVNGTTYYSSSVKSFTTSAAATYNLSVEAGTGISAVTGSTNNISASQNISITATVATGYTWSTWTKTGEGTLSTFTAGTKNQTITIGTVGDITLTASATENMSSLSTSCSYDAGDPEYSAPTVSGSATTVGYVTTRSITAATPTTNYTFAGWTITNGARTDGGSETATTITVRSNGDGAAVSVVANYEEILTSRWHLVGENVTSKVTFPDGWNVNSTSMMEKASGHADDDVVYGEVTVSNASGTYEFKVVDDDGANDDIWYGYSTGGTYLTWTATGTKTVYSGSGNSNNLKFTPTVAGTYTFKVDYSGDYPDVTITYPTSYTVTFGASPSAAADAPTNNKSITSGSLVLSGTSVTFTKDATPNSGYTWKGWYDNEEGDGDALGTDDTYTTTISGETEVYAVYTEDMHDVTIAADGDGGSITSPAGVTKTVSAGISTESSTITATPTNAAWRFWFWDIPEGVTLADDYKNTDATIKINATADSKTITAYFQPRFGLVGSLDADDDPAGGMPADGSGKTWDNNDAADFEVISFTALGSGDGKGVDLECERTLLANRRYKFRVVDRSIWKTRGCTSDDEMGDDANWQLNQTDEGSHDVHIKTKGAGKYTFKITNISNDANLYPSLTVERQSSYSVTFGYGTGGTEVTASGSTSGSIASEEYVAAGEDVTFTETHTTPGYTFKGWYDASSGGSAVSGMGTSDNVYEEIAANINVYAQYTENMCAVTLAHTGNGHIEIGGETVTSTTAGVTTTRTITAVPDAGWYFAGWTVEAGSDCSVASTAGRNDNESSSTTLSGLGAGTTGTVTASFVENDKIYFRNENETTGAKLWDEDNIYVYYNVSGFTAIDAGEAGVNPTAGNFAQMSPISTGSKIYWAYIPRAISVSPGAKIAFSNQWMGSTYPSGLYSTFYQKEGVYRTDFNIHLNMYVPACKSNRTSNSTKYYDDGYWMKYGTSMGQGASYYLKKGSGGDGDNLSEFKVVAENGTTIYAQYRFENTTAKTFYIANAAGVFYKSSDMTSVACTNLELNTVSPAAGFTVTPTAEGDYTFYIDQSGDTMKISVNYPIGAGDYRLDYTYASTKHLYSDIIKSNNAGAVTNVKKSVYIDPSKTGASYDNSLKLQKCTGLNALTKEPEWTSGVAISLDAFTEGKGVYVFDIEIDNTDKAADADVKSVSLSNVGLYTGDYYIKTDYAPGGWVSYTQNIMDKNTVTFSKSDDNTFDYAFCAWVNAGEKNVKCVIANDYNIQITDTLIGDAVLGTYYDDTEKKYKDRQYLLVPTNVRFSYNSYTNEIKRAYINTSGWNGECLQIKDMYSDGTHGGSSGSATLTDMSGTALTKDTISMKYKGNWLYKITVKAVKNTHIWLSANYQFDYTDHDQDFIGTSSAGIEVIGDDMSGTQLITFIYDFKTNQMMSAWIPSGTYGTEINLSSDVLLIHDRKSDGSGDVVKKIDLTTGGSVKNIDRVYSAFRFQKNDADSYLGLSGTPASTAASYYRYNYWISFPYDVKMTDIFGIPNYGSKWRIQYYDGKERAEKGWYKGDGTTTFWKTMPADSTLYKGEGYVLNLSPSAFKSTGTGSLWETGDEIYLFFPSAENFGTIDYATSSIELPTEGFVCTKGLYSDPTQAAKGYSHDVTDSYWHVFGIPTFSDATGTTGTGTYYKDEDSDEYIEEGEEHEITDAAFYFYNYDNDGTNYNTFTVTSSEDFTFQPMHAYMIQMHGTLNFRKNSVPASVAPRRTPLTANYNVQLELQSEDVVRDQTFVTLRDSAEVGFAFNEELMKIHNSGKTNIYSYAGPYDVAANILPIENRTVTLGVEAAVNGMYTFHMPSNFSGTVTLFDNVENTRTNLALNDYTVFLNKGTYEGRFYLEIDIRNAPTAIDGVNAGSLNDGKAHKFIQNGVMYILRDGVIYDAQGAKVK